MSWKIKNLKEISKNKVLLDASCLIALFKKEEGYKIVEDVISKSCISSVNIAEVIKFLVENKSIEKKKILEIVSNIGIDIIPFEDTHAFLSGEIINSTKKYGLSLGDRACIATGIEKQIPIYTSDKIWDKLKLNVDIRLIR